MDPNIILIAMLAVPVLLLVILGINAAQIFLSLCLGSVLVQFVAPDAATVLASTSAHTHGVPTSQSAINIGLLLLPVVLTAIIMIKSVKGKARTAFNLLPAVGASALGALLIVPLMTTGLAMSLRQLPLWGKLESLQTLIIGANTLLALLFLWMQRSKSSHDDKLAKH